jgi:hypothetical protein
VEPTPPHDAVLDFELSEDEFGDERADVLAEAADKLDEKGGHLGPGKRRKTAEGEVAAQFAEDRALLSLPEVLELDLDHLATEEQVRREDVLENWRFYWLKFPLDLWTRRGWGFNELEFKAEFNPSDEEARRPRVHDAVPTQVFATLASARINVNVGVGADFKFAAELPTAPLDLAGLPLEVQAAVRAVVGGDAGFTLSPRAYEVRAPVVRRSNPDLDSIRWRLSDSRLVEEQDPGLRVVLKVPRDQDRLEISAAMRARRNWSSFDAGIQGAFTAIGGRVLAFFKRGAPIGDTRTWDLSEALDGAEAD